VKVAVIVPAAGRSSRFGGSSGLGHPATKKKPFVDLKGRPVWLRSVEHFVNRKDVVQTLVVVSPDDLDWFREKFRPNLAFLDIELVTGGAERADSVFNALEQVRDEAEFVAVHDAARPLLCEQWIDRIFQVAAETGAAIPGIPVASTLKRVDANSNVEATVPRERLWEAQTPQVFRKELLQQAYAARKGNATDEASLVEAVGHPVRVVEGSPMNFKITRADDLRMAAAVLDALPGPTTFRPLHPFADEEPRFP
jgi:2-C-methyl-D-erythritol 4-phosphate cytidylyltransferase